MTLLPRPVVVVLSAAALASVAVVAVACPGGSGGPAVAGGKAAPKTGDPVARIGNEVVTVDDLQKKLDEQSPFIRARYAEAEKRRELLEAQVRFEVLAAEGLARGYADDPEVRDALKKIIVQRVTREEFDGRVQLKDVGDADLQRYFDEHKGDYQKPAMMRASVITVGAALDGAKAKIDEAQKLAADPKKRDDRAWFKDLVTRFSTDEATRPAGGDVRYLSRDEVTARFGKDAAEWLFASEEANAVSPVFTATTPAGTAFHVLKRTGHRKPIERSFDQVKNQIRNVVYREKRAAAFNAFVDELKAKHGVQTFPEKLSSLKVPTLPKGMPGLGDLHGDVHGDGHGDVHGDGHGDGHGDTNGSHGVVPGRAEGAANGGPGGGDDADPAGAAESGAAAGSGEGRQP
jgi:peptidyl-prolyl cis-trans isomerase C